MPGFWFAAPLSDQTAGGVFNRVRGIEMVGLDVVNGAATHHSGGRACAARIYWALVVFKLPTRRDKSAGGPLHWLVRSREGVTDGA